MKNLQIIIICILTIWVFTASAQAQSVGPSEISGAIGAMCGANNGTPVDETLKAQLIEVVSGDSLTLSPSASPMGQFGLSVNQWKEVLRLLGDQVASPCVKPFRELIERKILGY